jgi:two-component system cell cycle sensor histidine kinase/response regulator CckA
MCAFTPVSSPSTTLMFGFEQNETRMPGAVQNWPQPFLSLFTSCAPTWHFERHLDPSLENLLEGWRMNTLNLETLRFLGAGIAHDFNNLLTIMMANLELVKLSQDQSEPNPHLEDLDTALTMAKSLNKQLAALFQGVTLIRETVSLSELLAEVTRLGLHGSNIECSFKLAPELPPVPLDRCQIAQVITNLILNAKQAMPFGGQIEIEAKTLELAEGEEKDLAAGTYVQIKVQDTGIGMSAKQLNLIFAPHFTTKPQGKGLGLALCYTIVKRHKGQISVESQPGVGTTFRLLLPLAPDLDES